MLLDSYSSETEERRNVHKSTKVLFFLGTPHRGLNRAVWGDTAEYLDATTYTTDPVILQHVHSQPLWKLHMEFGHLVYARTFHAKTFKQAEPSNFFLWWSYKVCLTLLNASRRGD